MEQVWLWAVWPMDAWRFHEPHTGLDDCLNMLLSCFRKKKDVWSRAHLNYSTHLSTQLDKCFDIVHESSADSDLKSVPVFKSDWEKRCLNDWLFWKRVTVDAIFRSFVRSFLCWKYHALPFPRSKRPAWINHLVESELILMQNEQKINFCVFEWERR